jgi:hypothetical protein
MSIKDMDDTYISHSFHLFNPPLFVQRQTNPKNTILQIKRGPIADGVAGSAELWPDNI